MKKFTYLCLAFIFFINVAGTYAQGLYQKGTIELKKGKTIEAYIQIDFRFPQRFQQSLTYLSPKDYDKSIKTGKIKGSMKEKLEPKDVEGFTLADGRVFKTVKYVDITGKAIKMIPKRMILEQVADGRICMYKLYSRTTGSIEKELANLTFGDPKILIDYIQNNFQLLIQKDTDNPRNVIHINLLNYIGDNAQVKQNYDNNHYGLRNQFSEEKKFGKYVNKEYEAAFLRLLDDYNRGSSGTN